MSNGFKLSNFLNFQRTYDYPIIVESLDSSILNLDITSFLSFYHFSRFKKGKYFLKRLLKRIINKKLDKKMIWKHDFWSQIKVEKREITIKYQKENVNKIIENFLNSDQSSRRMKNIVYYKSLIEDNIDLGYPLYINGDCLNTLATDSSNPYDILMIDGARRFWANILNNNKKMYIWLITLKESDL